MMADPIVIILGVIIIAFAAIVALGIIVACGEAIWQWREGRHAHPRAIDIDPHLHRLRALRGGRSLDRPPARARRR